MVFDETVGGPVNKRTTFAQVPRRPVTVVLDRVRQHYNIGAIVLLCDTSLIDRLVVPGTPFDMRKRLFVQASRGTAHWVPIGVIDDAMTAISKARAAGESIIVVVEQTHLGISPKTVATPLPVCLALESGRDGVSPDIAALANATVKIPMLGMANSINVATPAATVLHRLSVLHDGAF